MISICLLSNIGLTLAKRLTVYTFIIGFLHPTYKFEITLFLTKRLECLMKKAIIDYCVLSVDY